MRSAKYLLIVTMLLFISGCSNGSSDVETMPSTNELTGSPSSTQSFNIPEFPPSDWPEKSIIFRSEDDGEIIYEEGTFSDRFWTPEGIAFTEECGMAGLRIFTESITNTALPTNEYICVSDKETAIAIASAICYSQGLPRKYVPCYVFFDTKEEIWIVVFREPNVGYASASATVAIRKDNAQVLAVWSEPG